MEKLKGLFKDIIWPYYLVPGGAAVIAWILTKMAALPTWQIFIVVIFSISCTFWGINQFDLWRNSRRKGFNRKSDAQIVKILRRWFDKRHYSSVPITNDKALLHIVATDHQNRKLNVLKPKDNPTVIRITLNIKEKEIEQIPQPHQNMARFNIAIEMARLGLLYHGEPPMFIEQELSCDEFLTESSFWNAIDKIRQGYVLIFAHFNRALILAKKEKQSPSTIQQVSDKEGSESQ